MKKQKNDKPETKVDRTPPADLLLQALETELGGVEVYTTALECVQNDDLRDEWEKYLKQTRHHVEVMRALCANHGLDPDAETPGRQVVRHIGKSLVKAMQMALGASTPEAAELVAAECVVLAETKDHLNWALLGELSEKLSGSEKTALQAAYDEIEEEEDEHLYHTIGWTRELWLRALGLPHELPPPEEVADVTSAEEAAAVKHKSMAQRG